MTHSKHKKIYRSGIIPFFVNIEGTKTFLFMLPSDPKYGGDKFQISKGKREENETALQTALREGKEEVGLREENIEWVEEVGVFLGRTTVFVAKVKNQNDFDQPCFETGDTKWMTLLQFRQSGRGLHVPVVEAVAEYIKNRGLRGDETLYSRKSECD